MKKYILFSFLTLFSIITAYGMEAGEPVVPAKFYIVRSRSFLDHDDWSICPRFVIEAIPDEKELKVLKPEPFSCRWPTVLRREFVECEGPSRILTESEWERIAHSKCRDDEQVDRYIRDGDTTAVKQLLERRAGPNGYESSHLMSAIIFHQPEIIALLLENGADANEEFDGINPLRLAFDSMQSPRLTFDNTEKIVRLLLEKRANVSASSVECGYTPLHWVAGANMEGGAAFLVRERGANVNAKAEDGFTPLHFALLKHCKSGMVQLLLAQGATVLAKTDDGRTARDIVLRSDLPDHKCDAEEEAILKLLEQYKTKEISELRALIEFAARSPKSFFSSVPRDVVSQIKQRVCS